MWGCCFEKEELVICLCGPIQLISTVLTISLTNERMSAAFGRGYGPSSSCIMELQYHRDIYIDYNFISVSVLRAPGILPH